MKKSRHAPRIAPSIAARRVPIASDLGPARWGGSRDDNPEEYLGGIEGLRVAHGGSVAGQSHSDVLPGTGGRWSVGPGR